MPVGPSGNFGGFGPRFDFMWDNLLGEMAKRDPLILKSSWSILVGRPRETHQRVGQLHATEGAAI
jgi:hypothetical protein